MKITGYELRKLIREIATTASESSVELTSKDATSAAISSAWPNNVTWEGQNVFKTFYESGAVNSAMSAIRREGYGQGQEVYLGYDPDNEIFIMGFDAFLDEGSDDYGDYGDYDDDDEMSYGGGGEVMEGVLVEMTPEGVPMDIIEAVPGGMYPAGLKAVEEYFPSVKHVRLD